jgi:hypothetical protein
MSTQPTQQPQPVVNKPPPPANNNFLGGDLMGFGFSTPPNNPPPQNLGGFSFNQPQNQPQPPTNNLGGFNLLGSTQPVQQQAPQPPVTLPQQTAGFQPIINNNPNKILAYDNTHLQIWIDCIK